MILVTRDARREQEQGGWMRLDTGWIRPFARQERDYHFTGHTVMIWRHSLLRSTADECSKAHMLCSPADTACLD